MDLRMAFGLGALAKRFCRELAEDTGDHPMQWRSIASIGIRAQIRDSQELARVVAHAVEAGWIVMQDGHSVALTEAERRLWSTSLKTRPKSSRLQTFSSPRASFTM